MARTKAPARFSLAKERTSAEDSTNTHVLTPPLDEEDRLLQRMSDKELLTRSAKALAALNLRDLPDKHKRVAAGQAWTAVVFEVLGRTTAPAYYLASLPKQRMSVIYNSCLIADSFLKSLGTWNIDQFRQLQRKVVIAVQEELRSREQNATDTETLLVGLRECEPAFNAQFPGYIQGGLLSILLEA